MGNKHLPEIEETYPINTQCHALYTQDNQWYAATVIDIIQSGRQYLIRFDDYDNEEQIANIHELRHLKQSKSISLKDSMQQPSLDKDLEQLIMCDLVGNGLKKKKYVNEMMDLPDCNDEKYNLNIEDERDFAMFMNESAKDDQNELDENDVEKYTVIVDGKKRRINPLNDICCICHRLISLTWHHLIPKETHKEYLRAHPDATRLFCNTHGIWVCRQCHSAIHGIYSNKELMKSYWKLEMLLESVKVQKWIKYVSKRKASNHYARGKHEKQNRIANIQRDKSDKTTKI